MEKYSKINTCIESIDICDLAVTCHLRKSDYVINNFRDIYTYIYIYILKVKVKLATFSRGVEEGATPFPGWLHFTLDTYLILLSVKQGGIKYHF